MLEYSAAPSVNCVLTVDLILPLFLMDHKIELCYEGSEMKFYILSSSYDLLSQELFGSGMTFISIRKIYNILYIFIQNHHKALK